MQITAQMRRSLGGKAQIIRWRKSGGAYASVRSMPQWVRDYFLAQEVPTNTNVLYALDGETDGLEKIRELARTDKDLWIFRMRSSSDGKRLLGLTVRADIDEPLVKDARDRSPAAKAAIRTLDADGHLHYGLHFYDGEEGADLLLMGDFCVFREGRKKMVAYHIVADADNAGFIETMEEGIVPASQAPMDLGSIFLDMASDIPAGAGPDGVPPVSESEVEALNARWNHDLRGAIKKG